MLDADVTKLNKTPEGAVQVVAKIGGKGEKTYNASLLLDCGGFSAPVRSTLNIWHPDRFSMIKYPTFSGGLRFKVLWLQIDGVEAGATPSDIDLANEKRCYVLVPKDGLVSQEYIRVGMMPGTARLPDGSRWRTGNLITRDDHAVWKANTPEKVFELLERALPTVREWGLGGVVGKVWMVELGMGDDGLMCYSGL